MSKRALFSSTGPYDSEPETSTSKRPRPDLVASDQPSFSRCCKTRREQFESGPDDTLLEETGCRRLKRMRLHENPPSNCTTSWSVAAFYEQINGILNILHLFGRNRAPGLAFEDATASAGLATEIHAY